MELCCWDGKIEIWSLLLLGTEEDVIGSYRNHLVSFLVIIMLCNLYRIIFEPAIFLFLILFY